MSMDLHCSLILPIIFITVVTSEPDNNLYLRKQLVKKINNYRRQCETQDMSTNNSEFKLFEIAQDLATKHMKLHGVQEKYVLPIDPKFGYTSWVKHGSDLKEDNVLETFRTDPIWAWYNEKTYFPNGTIDQWRNFTQMTWRGSMFVGCGLASTADTVLSVLCLYYPKGNIKGQYSKNVFQEGGLPYIIPWESSTEKIYKWRRYGAIIAVIVIMVAAAITLGRLWSTLPP